MGLFWCTFACIISIEESMSYCVVSLYAPACQKNLWSFLTPTYRMASLWRHLQSGVVSENGLIASKNAIDDAFHLARDEHHKNRTKVKVVELY